VDEEEPTSKQQREEGLEEGEEELSPKMKGKSINLIT